MVLGELVTHGIFRLFVPKGSEPRWYHVLAIIGSCMLLFSGFLGSLVNFVEGDVLYGIVSLLLFTVGYGCALLIRRSLETTVPAPAEMGAASDFAPVGPQEAPRPFRIAAWVDLLAGAAAALFLCFLAVVSVGAVLVEALLSLRPATLFLAASVLLVVAWHRLRRGDHLGAILGAFAGALLAIGAWWESLTGPYGPSIALRAIGGVALVGVNAWAALRGRTEKA